MTSTHFPKMVDTGHTSASLRFLLCLSVPFKPCCKVRKINVSDWLCIHFGCQTIWSDNYGCVITVEMERERERGREKRLYICNRIRNISSDCFEQWFSWTCILNNRYMFFPALIFVRIDGRACWMIHMQHVQYARQTTWDWSHGHVAGKYTHICPLFSMFEDMC